MGYEYHRLFLALELFSLFCASIWTQHEELTAFLLYLWCFLLLVTAFIPGLFVFPLSYSDFPPKSWSAWILNNSAGFLFYYLWVRHALRGRIYWWRGERDLSVFHNIPAPFYSYCCDQCRLFGDLSQPLDYLGQFRFSQKQPNWPQVLRNVMDAPEQ